MSENVRNLAKVTCLGHNQTRIFDASASVQTTCHLSENILLTVGTLVLVI